MTRSRLKSKVPKKAYCRNLIIKDVADNKIFWKTVIFSEKMNTNKNINLADNNNIMSSEIEIEKLNAVFNNIIIFM